MKVAIAGAGLTGAYLYRLLRNQGQDVDVFDRKPKTRCGISPCAWGTSKEFLDLVEAAGLQPEQYISQRFKAVFMDEFRIAAELLTFDKPKLVQDLLRGAEIKHFPLEPSEYHRIIDATGVDRAFLPKIEDEVILPCLQWRIRSNDPLEIRIKVGRIGYAWCFPLNDGEYHLGCGSLLSDPHKVLDDLHWIPQPPASTDLKICACQGRIRLTAPRYAQPFVRGNVWGLGEAVGCVAPLAGDGIVPGMKSARILLRHWENPDGYTRALLKEFGWMERERRVVDKLRRNEPLGLRDAWVVRKNSRRMNMKMRIKEAVLLLDRLR
jgi:flavin-dependent dehydrogenase